MVGSSFRSDRCPARFRSRTERVRSQLTGRSAFRRPVFLFPIEVLAVSISRGGQTRVEILAKARTMTNKEVEEMRATARKVMTGAALIAFLGLGIAQAGSELRTQTRLKGTRAAAGPMVGKAKFSHRLDKVRRKFSVEIERGAPGEMFDVMVSGVVVGTVLINDSGIGELDYDDTADPGDRDQRFPRNFPEIDGGEVIQVGPLTGTMQVR